MTKPKVVVAPDKFRGTATAQELTEWISDFFISRGCKVVGFPMSDGGEGLLDVFVGNIRRVEVTSAKGELVIASFKLDGDLAIIESASAAGLTLVGGPQKNDPIAATTKGVGELIKAAMHAGAKRIIVGCGGSATTDGGLGAIQTLEPIARMSGVSLVVAVDVQTYFENAATEFAPQKGASSAQVELLGRRLRALAETYRNKFGVEVLGVPGLGAAGGLAGGLAAIGGQVVSGFDLVAELTGFYEALENADLVVTGEGYLDSQSFNGKVVGGIVRECDIRSIPYLVIAGGIDKHTFKDGIDGARYVSLSEQVGVDRALNSPHDAIIEVLGQSFESIPLRDI